MRWLLSLLAGGLLLLGKPPVSIYQDVSYQYGEMLFFQAPVEGATLRLDTGQQVVTVMPDGKDSIDILQVDVGELGLGPVATLGLQWTVEGQPYGEAQEILYYDNRLPWEVSDGRGTIYAVEADEAQVEAALTGALGDIQTTLGLDYQGEVTVFVYPEAALLVEAVDAHQAQITELVVAYALPGERAILVVEGETLADDIRHEMVHLVIGAVVEDGYVPGWFNEGVALSLERNYSPDATLRDAEQAGSLMALEGLCTRDLTSYQGEQAVIAYAQSASLVDYLREQYGEGSLRRALDSYRQGGTCDDGIRAATGLGMDDIERDWLLWQQNRQVDNYVPVGLWIGLLIIGTLIIGIFVGPRRIRV